MADAPARTTIGELLDAARRRLRRLDPHEARDAVAAGALLVDASASASASASATASYRERISFRATRWSGVSIRRPATAIQRWEMMWTGT